MTDKPTPYVLYWMIAARRAWWNYSPMRSVEWAVVGKVRYVSSTNAARKMNVIGYLAKYGLNGAARSKSPVA